MKEDKKASLESRLPHACYYIDPASGGISPPLQFSTTYARDAEYEYLSDYSYSRSGNPSWEVLEQVCAELDGGAEADRPSDPASGPGDAPAGGDHFGTFRFPCGIHIG